MHGIIAFFKSFFFLLWLFPYFSMQCPILPPFSMQPPILCKIFPFFSFLLPSSIFFPTILSRCCVILSKLFSAHQPESYNPLFLFSFIDVWNFHHRSIKKFIELGFLISEYRFWLWIEGVVVRFYCMVLDLQDFFFFLK